MNIVFTGFLFGLMGSVHCAGMCGPIALSLPLRGKNFTERMVSGLIYNLGRTLMYGIMGLVFGLLGSGLQLLGIQKWVAIGMGSLMLLSVIYPKFHNLFINKTVNRFFQPVRQSIQHLFQQRSYKHLFLIGTLNSLLPCGLVYMAIAGAIMTGNSFTGALYLLLFGLGTTPMLLFISLISNTLSLKIRNSINKTIPYLVGFVGVLFILRGLCLGIPYISPSKQKLEEKLYHISAPTEDNTSGKSCCHPK